MPSDTALVAEEQEVQPTEQANQGLRLDLQPPPFSEVNEGPEYSNTFVTIELNNATRVKGKLLQFDAATESISIMESRALAATAIDMNTIKFMRLEKPYQLILEASSSEANHGIDVDAEARSFEVYFKDRTEITGKTYGSRNDKNGIHLYEQTKVGRKWRYCTHLFVSKTAIENHIIGGQIGDMLVQENQISQDALETALQDQQVERSRLIGDYLINQKIVDADELENALSRQKHMPNLKLGEILISEDLVSEGQLQEALKNKRKSVKVPLAKSLLPKALLKRMKFSSVSRKSSVFHS